MIDTVQLESVMQDFPEFSYKLNPVEEAQAVELCIERNNFKSKTGDFRKIRKVLTQNEDVVVLRNVLKGREDD
jgi:hypothetical protein